MIKECLFITREKDGALTIIPCNDYKEIDKSLLRRTFELDPGNPAMFLTSDEVYLMDQALTTQSPQSSKPKQSK